MHITFNNGVIALFLMSHLNVPHPHFICFAFFYSLCPLFQKKNPGILSHPASIRLRPHMTYYFEKKEHLIFEKFQAVLL